MAFKPQIKVPATYMRGGTSKGVFFNLDDLPEYARQAGPQRDALLLRIIGSPDPYQKHTDGMGGATSSTSKTVILSKSNKDDHDVDYLFGQVAIDKAVVDWSGNCGNLTAAVGAFAIRHGLVSPENVPENGMCTVKIWQANINKTIVARIPITQGQVQETGDFELDGVTFPAAEIQVEFLDPADGEGAMFPTGNLVDTLSVPNIGDLPATLINAGIPTIFINAKDVGLTGKELQEDINTDPQRLAMFESIRAHGAVKMGLITHIDEAASRAHTPKIAFVAPPASYVSSSGKPISEDSIDVNIRALSMGKLHHAMMGTAAVAIATAAVIPGTIVNEAATSRSPSIVTFGHPSGTLTVGAEAEQAEDGQWIAKKAVMGRSARRLMEGWVYIPDVTE
ncbi:2-methylaconitate cis-trans isomerase PrpF [Aestuariibacter sp. AA17]|uniref:2-methylaconitate cis-trans isomerase PrpF n=1 Tax=Fluctibacter corallii TaxID=2984329 RepID=A0ABT3A9A7_9ALTE|nr:2-methylaconitate cis-trans isomerase PrpF [Aestuariibacter sp. AA17]MCV2885258.1 2-methylaconitate cis-trans isomerase PrpF [Aestuariibacter sp. AA17]